MIETLRRQISIPNLKLLIGSKNKDTVLSIYDYMEPIGYHLDNCSNSDEVLDAMLTTTYDALILDSEMKDMYGIPLYGRLRLNGYSGIICLMSKEHSWERFQYYIDGGADGVISVPIHMLELEVRLLAGIRLAQKHFFSTSISWEGIEIDMEAHTVTSEGKELALSPQLFTLLSCLMKSAPRVVSHHELKSRLYGNTPPNSNAFQVAIHQLRRALQNINKPILKTVPKVGFRLDYMPRT
ncbi:response regulator transcription factor [Mailhella massiliensis]|uniref:response regulator transcription factor n=1 Tax=Mailhella massiliensis TaxID=1903261 RepID=UPI0023544BB7|nr:response regulator transcription factor [Mailhella massiliensis]